MKREKRSDGKADPAAKAAKMAQMRDHTAGEILKAIADFQERGAKITVLAIAKAAGVTPPLLYNTYPDLLEKIRSLAGKSLRGQRDATREELARVNKVNRELRKEVEELRADFANAASNINALIADIAVLRGIASGKVVPLLNPKAGGAANPSEP